MSEPRFLALVLLIAIAYSLNTIRGQKLNTISPRAYICRLKESHRSAERHSDFWIGPRSDSEATRSCRQDSR